MISPSVKHLSKTVLNRVRQTTQYGAIFGYFSHSAGAQSSWLHSICVFVDFHFKLTASFQWNVYVVRWGRFPVQRKVLLPHSVASKTDVIFHQCNHQFRMPFTPLTNLSSCGQTRFQRFGVMILNVLKLFVPAIVCFPPLPYPSICPHCDMNWDVILCLLK